MQNFAQAYKAVARQISSPREIEANLLLHAASRLRAVQDNWDVHKANLGEALLYNRKLWTILVGSVTNADNPLPSNIRQNIANLGISLS